MEFKKISVVVVNLNLADYLDEALESIVSQRYPSLDLIVVDGGSTDHSVDVIRKYHDDISYWISEPDEGQYDAVDKGFARSTGEIMYWINSDDKLLDKSLFAVNEVFSHFADVEWIMGFPGEFSNTGFEVKRIGVNWSRWSRKRYLTYDFQFIQQESCFWRRSLWEKSGGYISKEFKLAGDLELWNRFFRFSKLYTLTVGLAGFRYRGGNQRSRTQMSTYITECQKILKMELSNQSVLSRIAFFLLRIISWPLGLLFFYRIPLLQNLYIMLLQIPDLIEYDLNKQMFIRENTLVFHPPVFLFGKQFSLRK